MGEKDDTGTEKLNENEVENTEPDTASEKKEAEEPGQTGSEERDGEAEKKCGELLDKLQRTMAEFDNFRKRTMKEKAQIYDDAVRDTVEKLLPAIDNFERAIASAPNKGDGFFKGVDMIYRQLLITLDEMGVEVIASEGEPFDPAVHHAVAHAEDENYGENTVAEELQKGYKYKDRVIRPSMVKVAN